MLLESIRSVFTFQWHLLLSGSLSTPFNSLVLYTLCIPLSTLNTFHAFLCQIIKMIQYSIVACNYIGFELSQIFRPRLPILGKQRSTTPLPVRSPDQGKSRQAQDGKEA